MGKKLKQQAARRQTGDDMPLDDEFDVEAGGKGETGSERR